jgi:hypothetical protein
MSSPSAGRDIKRLGRHLQTQTVARLVFWLFYESRDIGISNEWKALGLYREEPYEANGGRQKINGTLSS